MLKHRACCREEYIMNDLLLFLKAGFVTSTFVDVYLENKD